VHRSDNFSDGVGKQHRDAIGDQRCYRKPGLGGDYRIAGRHRLLLWAVDHGDSPAMHLFHPDQALHRQPNAASQPLTVGSDRFRTITNVAAEVE
jgi:hypothetical protein